MSLLGLLEDEKTKAPDPGPPCVVCAAESETAVWGQPICYRCFGDWSREPSVTAGAIGFDPPETFAARAEEASAKWIRARKAVRR